MKKKILIVLLICMSMFLCISQNVYAERCAPDAHDWDWFYKNNQYHRAECKIVGCGALNSGLEPHDDNDGYCYICGERFAPSTTDNSDTLNGSSSNTDSSSTGNYTYYPVDLEFVGFRVGTKNSDGTITELAQKITNSDELLNWENSGLIINRLVKDELTYSTDLGVAYGKVIATSHYEKSKIKTKTFDIPFRIPDPGLLNTVTVYSTNPNLGGALSDKNFAKPNEDVSVWAEEYVPGTFKYWFWYNEDGTKEIITYSKNHSFKMPDANVVLYAHFEYTPETHNLYVTSNNPDWGEAWTYDNEQKETWHNDKAITGKEYDIKYEAKPGYEFVRWEYRPTYENPREKNGKIIMPKYDITVTAIFKEKDIVKKNDPTLYISVNNPTWGEAYVVTNDGNIYANTDPVGSPNSFIAQYNETYTIVYTPYTGYYFTGWITSPKIGLNKYADELTMPDTNLTLTAFFSPLNGELYDITTRVEPEEAGKIVGDIPRKLPKGDTFTASVEVNEGYIFDHWYYEDRNGNKVELGSNPTVNVTMPGHSIELVAVFHKLGIYNLYVTSNNPDWGEAYTEEDDGSRVWKRLAIEGNEYPINQIAKTGYEFVRWEYRPRYENPSEQNAQIKMPGHDITVTAIFKEKDIIKKNDPTLYISVNNPTWGEAYIVTDNGEVYANKDPEGTPNSFTAENGKIYKIVYTPYEGYYFTGWITSPEIGLNPFAPRLTMPDNNLTLTAFFAPIPEGEELYDITTRVEPPEGGRIIGSIPSKLPEGYIFGATAEANEGYVLDYWYYLDPDGKKVVLGSDTTIIVTMPGHAIELVAVFTKAGTYNLYVTSNNPEWGEAYTKADNGSKVWKRRAIEGKEYPINQIAKTGYEFVRWEYRPRYQNPSEQNGQIKMPGHDITVTAIFKEKDIVKRDDPTLYISVNNPLWGEAYIVADSGDVYANKDPEGSPNSFTAKNGKTYTIVYTPYTGYYFTGWITSPEIGLDPFADEMTMPDTNLTLTAFFSPVPEDEYTIRAISNNYSLGDVYIVTDDGEVHSFKSDESGIIFKPDIPYRVVSTEIDGRFDNFTINGEDIEKYKTNVKDLKPQELLEILQEFNITAVHLEESEAYKKLVDRDQISIVSASLDYSLLFGGVEEMMAIYAEFISPYDVNGISIIHVADTWSIKASKEAIKNTEIVIDFKDDDDGDDRKNGGNGGHSLTVEADPEEAVKSTSGSRDSAKAGETYPVSVKLNNNWDVVGWYYNDPAGDRVDIRIASSNINFEMPNHDVVLYADCAYSGPTDDVVIIPSNDGKKQPLLITSIRDLRWKNHFVDNKGNYIISNALKVPNEDTVIAEHKDYPTEIKMGYAVEFSMVTAMVTPENARLVIKPRVMIGNSTTEIDPAKLYDAMSSNLVELGKKYSEIVIYGNNKNPNANFQTKATATSPKPKNNNIEYDEITWEWLYYLPAEIRNTDKTKITEDITIKFDIEVYDGDKKVADYVTYLSKNNISNWKGKVFKYSAKDSVLDDIYNNAQN